MEPHLLSRPKKTPYPIEIQNELRESAIKKIKDFFLPDSQIEKIILIGSSVKNNFGEYEAPGFRGSLFSDFDFILIVSDDYEIPNWLEREPDGKPFPDAGMNLAYRNKKIIDNKYDFEIFFVRAKDAIDPEIQSLAEEAGIPLQDNSQHPHLIVYQK